MLGGNLKHPLMGLPDKVVTVLTKTGNKSALVAQMKAEGAEVWGDQMIRASYEGLKKRLPGNPYKDMRSLYGKYAGQTVFVAGAGPSLLSCLGLKLPGPTFAINRAIKGVKADYFCFCDMKAKLDSGDHENAKAAEWAFGSALNVFLPQTPGYLIEANGHPSGYQNEAVRPLYWNGSTFSWALHLAIKTKPKRIVMIGCEFSLEGYFDGAQLTETGPTASAVVAEAARARVDEMFGPDKKEWFDPAAELLDASGGYLPIPKVKLENVL